MGKCLSRLRLGRRNEAVPLDPDERWSNLYREREKNVLYRWVGMRSGGELISIYEKEGEEGVLLFAQEKMEPMMYNEGRLPQLIKYADYMRWKKSVNTALGITDDVVLSEESTKFLEHEAQWRLNKRGIEGESIIHVLLNREEPFCVEIARILIQRYPGLSKDIYLGDEMFGQSPLHLAIVHDDYDTVQLLLENGADVNSRACGQFFLPQREVEKKKSKDLAYEGYAYYGEFPLAFAGCFENKDIYDLLIEYGAAPDLQDSFGNTCLHMCVINYSTSMYSYAVRHWHKPAKTNIPNFAGLTPLTLASKLGRKEIFEEMLELTKLEFWRFSDMTCSAYPLDTLDTIRPDGSTNYDSALMTVINGNTPEHLEMIGSEVIQRLLADKWKAYASRKLYERLALLILHLICLSFVVYLRPSDVDELYGMKQASDYVRSVFEILTIIICCWFVFIQQLDELQTQGPGSYVRNLKTAPAKIVYILANFCILACVPARFLQVNEIEESLLVFALPGAWIFLLFFARSAKLTGPFVQMIYSMIAGDMIRFAIISSIFIISFSQVFYFVGKDIWAKQLLPTDNEYYCPVMGYRVFAYNSYLETFVTIFRAMMGNYDYEEFACTNYEALTKALFVLYLFIMPIMMINILIAMMGNTYMSIILQAEKAWRQQYAQIVMVLERSMNKKKLATCQLEYSIRLNEPGRETRGLMVIKQTKKTKASQRKQAIINWKYIGRKVMHMVKELGSVHAKFLLHTYDRMMAVDEASAIGLGGAGFIPTTRVHRSPSNVASTFEGGIGAGGGHGGLSLSDEHLRLNASSRLHPSHPKLTDPISIPSEHQTTGILIDTSLSAVVFHAARQYRRNKSDRFEPEQSAMRYDANHLDALGEWENGGRRLPSPLNRSQSTGLPNGNAASRIPSDVEPIGDLRYRKHTYPYIRTISSSGGVAMNASSSNQYVHLTQRALPAVEGSRVRGIEMLPSSDIPNIPSSTGKPSLSHPWHPALPSTKRSTLSGGQSSQQTDATLSPAVDGGERPPDALSHFSNESTSSLQSNSQSEKTPSSSFTTRQSVRSTATGGIRVRADVFRKKDSIKKTVSSSSSSEKSVNKK